MNTVAIITGSSQGIGQTIAARLAQDGVNVAIDYHTHAEGAEETLRQVEAAGAKGVIVKPTYLSLVRSTIWSSKLWQPLVGSIF